MAAYELPCVPFGRELVVTVKGVLAAATVMLRLLVAVCAAGEVESVTFTVKLNVPDAVGVPEIVPVEAVKLRPVARVPELMLQLYGVVPPEAASVALYAVPCVPFASELVVTLRLVGAAETLMLKAWEAVSTVELESDTCTVKLAVPAWVGVPVIWPVLAPRLNPAGRAPEEIDQ